MPVTHSTKTTKTSITWNITGFTSLSKYKRYFNFMITDSNGVGSLGHQVIREPGTTDVSYTYTGLEPGKTYSIRCTMETDSGSGNAYNYGPLTVTTDPPDEATTVTFYGIAYWDRFYLSASLNKVSYSRRIIFKVDGVEVGTVAVGANSYDTYKNITCSFESLNGDYKEGGTANLSCVVSKYDYLEIVGGGGRDVKIPYDDSIFIRATNITDSAITVNVYGLNGNKDYARSLRWYRKGPGDSDYVQISATQIPAGSGVTTFNTPLSSLKANSAYSFKVELIGPEGTITSVTTSANTLEVPGKLAVDNIGESSVTLILSGLTNAIGRTVKWFYKKSTDTSYVSAGITELTNNASSVSKVVSGLINETVYNFKAEIYDANDTSHIIGIKTAIATTQRQVAVMFLEAATSVSLRVILRDMETNVNYDKYIYWYIKRSTDANYTDAGYDVVTADSGASSQSHLFAGLVSSTIGANGELQEAAYDVRSVIKKDNAATMATLNGTYTTTLRDSDIPKPVITEALQIIGEKKMELWWEAPEHVTSSEAYVHYDIEMSSDGEAYTLVRTVDQPPADYSEVELPAFGVKYFLRIKSYPDGGSEGIKLSNVVEVVLTEDFDWETVGEGAPCIIRADKWNLLIRYIRKRLSDNKISGTYEMSRVKTGQLVTAYGFNQLLRACNAFYTTGITEKHPGDAVRAADLLKLQEAVNYKEEIL